MVCAKSKYVHNHDVFMLWDAARHSWYLRIVKIHLSQYNDMQSDSKFKI